MPEISMIVPVYKAERYLPACIDSILNQSFSDFELILVDDGSPDACGAICEEYAARDSRIRVLRQENQGQAAARNHALEIAGGKWICFVDSDDLIHPGMVEALYDAVKDGSANISMCQMLEAPELPEDFCAPKETAFEVLHMDEETLVSLLDRDAYPGWVACAKLIPKAVIEHYLFCPGRVYEDNEAVCRWLLEAKTLAVTQEKLYFYRTNPVSTTQSGFSLKKLDYLWALESILRFYHEKGYMELCQRFCDCYAEAAAGDYRVVRYELNRPDVARQIQKTARKIFGKDRIPLTKAQFETMLDAMHPWMIRLYWPLEAVYRNVREGGISGLARKVRLKLRKGDKA